MRARSNQVRIIAGQWRGRKLVFPQVQGLRPTSDRLRETLFNWLAADLPGAACLDLFAGSGALGFEAASRGSARVVMVERNRDAVRGLRESRQRLNASAIEIRQQEADSYLCGHPERFDVVFLDPPFNEPELVARSFQLLTASGWLKAGAHIYLELPVKAVTPPVPGSWAVEKQKRSGQVACCLYRYQPA